MNKVSFPALCLLLSACASPEELELQRQRQEQADIKTCIEYGLNPGSEAFGMCRLELDLARQRQYNSYHHPHPHYYGGYSPHRYGAGIGFGF